MNKYIRTIITWFYFKIVNLKFLKSEKDTLIKEAVAKSNDDKVKIAFICDEMTWCDYSDYASSIFVHSAIWKEQLEKFKPSILFCESAWCGIDKYINCWRAKVYKDKRLAFENRKEILKILKYCKENNIKTVFWNKEDPTFFENEIYDFVSTALMFDFIFTTDADCIKKYQELGHKYVFLMTFGVNLDMFYSNKRKFNKHTVVFAGSWFGDQKQRCSELSKLLDYVIDIGLKLDIYDRKSESKEKRFRFPKKYQQYIRPAISYEHIASIISDYEYAININTVKNSSTMFSRGVLQLVATGNIIISNSFYGIENISDCIQIIDNSQEDIIIFKGIERNIINHSCEVQIEQMLKLVSENSNERGVLLENKNNL